MTRHPAFSFMTATMVVVLSSSYAVATAQQGASVKPKPTPERTTARKAPAIEIDPMLEVRRTTAIGLINALADEARNFRDETLRARVQARSADALWETDRERARALFRRAWEAAESADAESERRMEEERRRQVAERGYFSIRRPPSLRNEVLRLAARRERALGEEFLTKLEEARKQETDAAQKDALADAQADSSARRKDPQEAPTAITKRLQLATQLLEDGDVERAVQFADPALGKVSMLGLEFLVRLRLKAATAADERYAALLARVAADPEADANTVSLLSSYLFTPGLYSTFAPDAGSNTTQQARVVPPADVSPQLRAAFFRAAAAVLLRPVPPPDQDRTSTGRAGWYLVIARLLPLFEQYAPERTAALRSQLAILTPDTPEGARRPDNTALTRGLTPEDPGRDRIQETLNRLDRAKSDDERDAIYVEAAFEALSKQDARLDEFVSKIQNTELRQKTRAYVDYERVRKAIGDKDVNEALRIARAGQLPPIQRTWALTEIARLLAKDEPGRAVEMLDEATIEARRIDAASPDRARALVAIATQIYKLDRARTWEVMSEVVKASNAAAEFRGEDGTLSVHLHTMFMTSSMNNSVESFDLTGLFAALAADDLNRAVELARAFNGESPRAVATLAIARAVLDKKR